jgi:hypothetical protein
MVILMIYNDAFFSNFAREEKQHGELIMLEDVQ